MDKIEMVMIKEVLTATVLMLTPEQNMIKRVMIAKIMTATVTSQMDITKKVITGQGKTDMDTIKTGIMQRTVIIAA